MTRRLSAAVTALLASQGTDVRRTWMTAAATSVKTMPPVLTWCRRMNVAVLQDSWVNSLSIVYLRGATYDESSSKYSSRTCAIFYIKVDW